MPSKSYDCFFDNSPYIPLKFPDPRFPSHAFAFPALLLPRFGPVFARVNPHPFSPKEGGNHCMSTRETVHRSAKKTLGVLHKPFGRDG